MTTSNDHDATPRLRCPRCGCTHLPVVRTVQRERSVIRYRACRNCGRRMTTRERIIADRDGPGSTNRTEVTECARADDDPVADPLDIG